MRLLLDLDGTLTDPFVGITESIRHALGARGHDVPDALDLRWCIGPPLAVSFGQLLDTGDPETIAGAIHAYRERFSTVGLLENEVYPGIGELLQTLAEDGHTLSIATSKPTCFAERIVDRFDLGKHLLAVDGSELDGRRGDKTSLIAHILERDGLDPEQVLMVGDRSYDMIGAAANQVRGIGVLWGYGSRQELESAGAARCIDRPQELPEAVHLTAMR